MQEFCLKRNKNTDLKKKIRILRQIHLNKIADKIDVSDLKENNIPKYSVISREKSCWRCGKISFSDLCQECRNILKEQTPAKKPTQILDVSLQSILSMIKKLTDAKSMFVDFTIEDILQANPEFVFDGKMHNIIKMAISQGLLTRNNECEPKFRLTKRGIDKIAKM